jgi:hypothetical protein
MILKREGSTKKTETRIELSYDSSKGIYGKQQCASVKKNLDKEEKKGRTIGSWIRGVCFQKGRAHKADRTRNN